MKELILITGASSGIGREMARLLARQNYDLILVARRQDRLIELRNELEEKHLIRAHIIVADLSHADSARELYDRIKDMKLNVTMLVNNAGFGEYGDFATTPLHREMDMVQVNISSLVTLTKLFGADMRAAGHGHILNMASILSFFPFPYYAVYAATKAFVLSFTESIQTEWAGSGVHVTAFCPGPTDTEFTTDNMLQTNAYKSMKPVKATDVAQEAVHHLLHGKGIKVHGFMNKVLVNTPRFSPRWLTLKINKHMATRA